MKIVLRIAASVSIGTVLFFGYGLKGSTQSKDLTASQKFKNIKVLKDMPAEHMGKVMSMMAASLGVDCDFCHKGEDFAAEGNEHKDTAREMLEMTFALNKQYFRGRPEINCNTCHHGIAHPQPGFPLEPPVARPPRPKQPETKPTAEEIVAKFKKAVGTPDSGGRYITAVRIEPSGKSEAEQIWIKGEKMRVETAYPDAVVTDGYDGANSWKKSGAEMVEIRKTEADYIKSEALMYSGKLIDSYTKLDFRFLDKIDGREAYMVIATTADNMRDRLYFDVETGYLIRRMATTPTVLGTHVVQTDYSDFKKYGGFAVPRTTKFSMPHVYWTRKIKKVKVGASIDDSKFVK
ncbi:MAG: c-type cytochrome [Pyrinomonadaceae bacterium]